MAFGFYWHGALVFVPAVPNDPKWLTGPPMAHHLDLDATFLALFPDMLRETFSIVAVKPMLWGFGVAFVAVPSFKKVITITKLRSEEHTSELQSLVNLVCRLLLEKKRK